VDAVLRGGGTVIYRDQLTVSDAELDIDSVASGDDGGSHVLRAQSLNAFKMKHSPTKRGWLDRLLHPGQVDEVFAVHAGPGFTRADLRLLSRCRGLRELQLCNARSLDGSSLEELRHIEDLTNLNLNFTEITDADLSHLSSLQKLQVLQLESPRLTRSGFKHLRPIASLRQLYLGQMQLSPAGLAALAELQQLDLLVTFLGKADGESLQEKLPNCVVLH
jgi:hypothetical protein